MRKQKKDLTLKKEIYKKYIEDILILNSIWRKNRVNWELEKDLEKS